MKDRRGTSIVRRTKYEIPDQVNKHEVTLLISIKKYGSMYSTP